MLADRTLIRWTDLHVLARLAGDLRIKLKLTFRLNSRFWVSLFAQTYSLTSVLRIVGFLSSVCASQLRSLH